MALRFDVNTLTGPQTVGKELIISQPSVSLSLFPSPLLRLPSLPPHPPFPPLPSPLQSPVLRCDLISAAWRSMPPVAGGSIALNYGFISPPLTQMRAAPPPPHHHHHHTHTHAHIHNTPTDYSQSRSIPYNLIFIHFSINPEIAFICRIRQAK